MATLLDHVRRVLEAGVGATSRASAPDGIPVAAPGTPEHAAMSHVRAAWQGDQDPVRDPEPGDRLFVVREAEREVERARTEAAVRESHARDMRMPPNGDPARDWRYDPIQDRWVELREGRAAQRPEVTLVDCGYSSRRAQREDRAARPAPKDPTSAPLPITHPDVDAEYLALATDLRIGLTDILERDRFAAFLSEHGLRVYDLDEVTAYLAAKYGVPPGGLTPEVRWGWRPLRRADRKGHEHEAHPFNGKLQPSVAPYAKPVPYPVLLTVKAIRDAFPEARFFVSDDLSGEHIPDPFLLVRLGERSFVIERWDEPAFRSTK